MGDKNRPALIALDFDHTLIHWKGEPYVSPETRQTLADAIAQGIHVGLCSGRWWWNMRDVLENIGMPWGKPFPSFVITREKLVYWVRDGRLDEGEFADWNRARSAEMEDLAQACLRHGSKWVAAMKAEGIQHRSWNLYGDYGLEFVLPSVEEAERARILLAELVRGIPNACVHRNSLLANVALATGTKGATLRGVAEILGLPPERVLGMGDSLNDLDMVDGRYGLSGATMENADPAIKAAVLQAGGIVASGVAEAGVGEIIRSYLGMPTGAQCRRDGSGG